MGKTIGIGFGTNNFTVAFRDMTIRVIFTCHSNEEFPRSCVSMDSIATLCKSNRYSLFCLTIIKR